MKFDRTVNLILEESEEKPKYELISPKKYSRLYQVNKKVLAHGYIRDVIDLGRIGQPETISRVSDEVKKIKENWVPAIIITGYELVLHLRSSKKSSDIKKYNISTKKNYSTQMVYIINDTTDITLGDVSWKYWLEPVITFKDYTSQGTADAFDKLIDEL